MKQTNYAYGTAYIRAVENGMLTKSDIESLVSAADYSSAARILNDRGYFSEKLTYANSDELLKKKLSDFRGEAMWAIGGDSVFDIFLYKNDFHNLKAVLKSFLIRNENCERLILSPSVIDYKEFVKAAAEGDFSRLPEFIAGAAKRGFEIVTETGDGAGSDSVIDKALMDCMMKKAEETKNKFLIGLIRLENTLTDIKIAYRSERALKDRAFLEEALSENSDIERDALAKAASEGKALEFLREKGFSEAADAAEKGEIEKYTEKKTAEYLKSADLVTFGIEPVIAFLYKAQKEVQTVRIILGAKQNGVDERVLRSFIQ